MITWSGLIGKIVEFVATKLLDKTIDLSLDKKSRAARRFYELHESIINLEFLIAKIIRILGYACKNKKHIVFSKHIVSLKPEIERVSISLLKSLGKAMSAIMIIDPDLAKLIGGIRRKKGEYLSGIERLYQEIDFGIEFKDFHPFQSIHYSIPRIELTKDKLEKYYHQIANTNTEEKKSINDTLIGIIVNSVENNTLSSKDFEKFSFLISELKRYQKDIKQAKEDLRQFIASKFSIEDLLYN